MAHGKRGPQTRRRRAGPKAAGKEFVAPTKEDRNRSRRRLYGVDDEFAEKQRESSRRSYYKDKEKRSPLRGGLRHDGRQREATNSVTGAMTYIEGYTMPEAADALGRNPVTFKRWLTRGMVPEPVWSDTARGYRLFERREMEIMARHLQEMERTYAYFGADNTEVIEAIHQAIYGLHHG